MRGWWEGAGKPGGPDVFPSAGVRTASLTCFHETRRNVCSFQTYPLPNFKSHWWGWRALTNMNTITARVLFPALERQKANPTPLRKKKKNYSMLQDIAGAQQEQALPQRLTARQAAAQLADACQQPPALAKASPGHQPCCLRPPHTHLWHHLLWWWSIAAHLRRHRHGQALNPPETCRKWEFLVWWSLVAVKDR